MMSPNRNRDIEKCSRVLHFRKQSFADRAALRRAKWSDLKCFVLDPWTLWRAPTKAEIKGKTCFALHVSIGVKAICSPDDSVIIFQRNHSKPATMLISTTELPGSYISIILFLASKHVKKGLNTVFALITTRAPIRRGWTGGIPHFPHPFPPLLSLLTTTSLPQANYSLP